VLADTVQVVAVGRPLAVSCVTQVRGSGGVSLLVGFARRCSETLVILSSERRSGNCCDFGKPLIYPSVARDKRSAGGYLPRFLQFAEEIVEVAAVCVS